MVCWQEVMVSGYEEMVSEKKVLINGQKVMTCFVLCKL